MTTPYAEVIGDPIVQSKSPVIHGYWLRKLGLSAEYGRAHVLPATTGLARRRAATAAIAGLAAHLAGPGPAAVNIAGAAVHAVEGA